MRATLIVLLVTVSMLPLGFLASTPAAADNIHLTTTTFGNGQSAVTTTFQTAGVNTENSLSVQTGLNIDSAAMTVSTVAQTSGSKAYPTNLTVDIGNDNQPEYQFRGPGYGQFGRQTLFSNDATDMSASVGINGPTDNSVSFLLPKGAIVKSATMNLSAGGGVGDPKKVLNLYCVNNYYSWNTNPQNELSAFASDFSKVDSFDAHSAAPTWNDISSYGKILTWADWDWGYGYNNPSDTGNLLARYVDNGGSLVVCWGAFYTYSNCELQGNFLNNGYYALQPTGSYGYMGSVSIGSSVANHPVMKNVNSIGAYYGYNYVCPQTSSSGGSTIATYSYNSYILAAEKTVNGVIMTDINMFPVSGNGVSYQWSCYQGDGAQLLRNALCYSGGGPLTFTANILNDSTIEVNKTDFAGNVSVPDFSASLNSYMATATPSVTDAYGNQFVSIPMNITSPGKGTVKANKLEVLYDYSMPIDPNPSMGNLTNSVADLQSTIQGKGNYTIPIGISSASGGKVKLSNLVIKMTPPTHAPHIDSFYPQASTTVKEDTTLVLGVNATDIYGNPMSYVWTLDGAIVGGAASNTLSHYFDFLSSGTHTVTVNVSNPISEKTFKTMTWTITVLNVDRSPSIDSFLPVTDPTINENTSQTFSVAASDPDPGDMLSYVWSLDGKTQPKATDDNYTFASNYSSAGQHTVKVVVMDSFGASEMKTWTVTVLDVNVAPVITDFSPRADPTINEMDSWTFSITPHDFDVGNTLTTTWTVDGKPVFTGNPYTYTTDYSSAGIHKIVATVSDGQLTDTHSWTVTVLNLDRLPIATIDSPADQTEYMQGDTIHFSAQSSSDPDNESLTYTWKEGGVNVSDQVQFDRAFSPGIHTITVEVRDPEGGLSTASVHFRVRYIEISVVVGLDRFEVQAGNKVDVIVTMTNIGDANASSLPLAVTVDGASIGSTTVGNLSAGGAQKQIYTWKAVKGTHTVTASIGDQKWSKTVTVAAAPPPPPTAGIGDYIVPIIIVIVVIGLVAFGAMALRKK